MEAGIASADPEYKEFREDGWPLCPNCGLDELANPAFSTACAMRSLDEKPTIEEFLQAGLWCYYCGWKSSHFKASEGKR